MTTTEVRSDSWPTTAIASARSSSPVFAVVGFDGSVPSRAALETATRLIGVNGHLEVVYVAHLPAVVEMSVGAVAGMRETLDDIAIQLNAQARTLLDHGEPRWHFQRRNGSVTQELVAAAIELQHHHGPDATIVIVVGASAHFAHHLAGSVPVALARDDAGFPLLVVPSARTEAPLTIDTSEFLG